MSKLEISEKPENSKIFETIEYLCKKKGVSVTKVCVEITGGKGNLPTWRKGSINTASLIKLSNYFNVSADYILGLSENPNQANTNCNVIEHGDNIGNMDITINQAENDFLSCFLKQFQSLTYSEQLEIMNIVNEKAKR